MSLKAKPFSTHDPVNKHGNENEDACWPVHHATSRVIAVADGAGGGGFYCGKWAQALVKGADKLEKAIEKQRQSSQHHAVFRAWFVDTSRKFYEQTVARLQHPSDIDRLARFTTDGSFATLTLVWCAKRGREYQVNYWGVGDSCIFHFRKVQDDYQLLTFLPNSFTSSLDEAPKLLNWQHEPPTIFKPETRTALPDDVFILCTDALARMLIQQLVLLKKLDAKTLKPAVYERVLANAPSLFQQSLSGLLAWVKQLAKAPAEKRLQELRACIDAGLLQPDDLTLIYATL